MVVPAGRKAVSVRRRRPSDRANRQGVVIHGWRPRVEAVRSTHSEFAMRKLLPILLMCLGASGAFAQTTDGGVTVSNDPAKVAAVEKHAQELKSRAAQQQSQAAAKPATKAKSKSTGSTKAKSKTKKAGASTKPAATK